MSSSENSLVEIFGEISDPRQEGKVKHNLVELLIVAVVAVLCGADNFVEIELWAKSRLDWLRKYLTLEHGIASHDTFGAVFAGIDASQFSVCFSRWASGILPVSDNLQVVAIDGKTSGRTKQKLCPALHLVSAVASENGLVLGQQATAEKSNEKTQGGYFYGAKNQPQNQTQSPANSPIRRAR
ncbi:MAG: hypothetical protein CR974_01990 [Gammaproteobacteria bacterium]|nr:MAG: hypothetical protein CR974_01990 [Gammaproteobacteria bacterium]